MIVGLALFWIFQGVVALRLAESFSRLPASRPQWAGWPFWTWSVKHLPMYLARPDGQPG